MKAQTILRAYRMSIRETGMWPSERSWRQRNKFADRLDKIATEYDAHQQRLADAKANIEQMRKEYDDAIKTGAVYMRRDHVNGLR